MTLLSIDRSDLIKTIEDDDTVVADDDSSGDEDVAQPKKNKAARMAKKDFETGDKFLYFSYQFCPLQILPLFPVRRNTCGILGTMSRNT